MAFYKDEELEQVQKNLPCIDCSLSGICKYSGTVNPVENIPDIFEVTYVCTQKQKYTC